MMYVGKEHMPLNVSPSCGSKAFTHDILGTQSH